MRNWQKKLTYILLISVIIGTYLKLNSQKSPKVSSSTKVAGSPVAAKKQIHERVVFETVVKCLSLAQEDEREVLKKVGSQLPAWENLHFKKNGEIYRIREFNDDGPNGDIRKLILYKEDKDEFAHIEKVWKSGDFSKIRAELLSESEIIHREKAVIIDHKEKNIFVELVNSKITRLRINDTSVLESCSN